MFELNQMDSAKKIARDTPQLIIQASCQTIAVSSWCIKAACAAANRATGTLYGEHDT